MRNNTSQVIGTSRQISLFTAQLNTPDVLGKKKAQYEWIYIYIYKIIKNFLKIWGILQNVILSKEKVDDQLCGHKLTQ